jgi:hypothetical protein
VWGDRGSVFCELEDTTNRKGGVPTMNLTMMLFLYDFGLPFGGIDTMDAGPVTPRPADPSPEGGEAEPVGDDESGEREHEHEHERDD